MTAHTPGPWMVRFRHDGSAFLCMGLQDEGPHKKLDIALWNDSKTDIADANVIGAAPDLLMALELLLPYATHADSCGDHDTYNNASMEQCGCGLDSALAVAREAIADARGEDL